jgi:hypothetical protein
LDKCFTKTKNGIIIPFVVDSMMIVIDKYTAATVYTDGTLYVNEKDLFTLEESKSNEKSNKQAG